MAWLSGQVAADCGPEFSSVFIYGLAICMFILSIGFQQLAAWVKKKKRNGTQSIQSPLSETGNRNLGNCSNWGVGSMLVPY